MFTASEFFPPLNSTELMSSGARLRIGAATAGIRLNAMAVKAASSVGRMSILLVTTQRLAPVWVPARRCARLLLPPSPDEGPHGPLRRTKPDARVLPRIRRRRGHSVYPAELAARMGHEPGHASARRDPRRRRQNRHPHARRAGGVRRPRARARLGGADLRVDLRGDR